MFFPAKILKNINNSNIFYSPFFNIPRGIKIPVYITIHDIIFLDIPEIASKAGVAVRKWFFRRAYNKSKIIFTVSNFSKARIEHHLGACKNIIVTHSAVRPLFLEYRKNNKIIQKEQTIVFLGNIKKHKGLDTLLDAFKLAKEEGLHHKLLIIGSKEKFRTTDNAIIKKLETFEDDSVSFTGFISDDKLMELLSKASLLVQPSVYEGFCLPPLEAMVLGTHALISDIAVLKEIYSNFPVTYFKEGDILDLKENIIKLLYNKPIITLNLSDELRDKYAFEKTASVILENILYK
ncbi:MAG: glycosyltransferase family 4 protein [Treponema sp.]|nr:glycosyltransferase family 4 protein [Treponema sp.]